MTDEYIRKADASDWLKQYGQDVLHGKYKFSLMYIWKNLMDLPSADVVQVVRCKDCRKCSYDPLFNYYWCNLTLGTRRVKFDDFCSYGERREE